MRKLFALGLIFCATLAYSQSSNDLMLGGAMDFLKTDNDNLFDKAQVGFELNYFVIRKFTITAGAEIWTKRDESFVFGSRYYFTDHFFARGRGLIGQNDFSLGAGGAIPLKNSWRLELIGDFYFEGEFAVRTGLAYIIPLR
ncbi:MAG: hypothetical protein HRU69_07970 [Flammeovirgaceae bacterium]|nr:MAG: hypothetical protein HRU69_07970 [Flammeovirgaceae bacterium]